MGHATNRSYNTAFIDANGNEIIAILVAFDEDGDGALSDEEAEHYYDSLVSTPLAHIGEEYNVTSWSAAFELLASNASNYFADEGALLCLNETIFFATFDSDSDGHWNASEIAPAASHMSLMLALCEAEHTPQALLPLCDDDLVEHNSLLE